MDLLNPKSTTLSEDEVARGLRIIWGDSPVHYNEDKLSYDTLSDKDCVEQSTVLLDKWNDNEPEWKTYYDARIKELESLGFVNLDSKEF